MNLEIRKSHYVRDMPVGLLLDEPPLPVQCLGDRAQPENCDLIGVRHQRVEFGTPKAGGNWGTSQKGRSHRGDLKSLTDTYIVHALGPTPSTPRETTAES